MCFLFNIFLLANHIARFRLYVKIEFSYWSNLNSTKIVSSKEHRNDVIPLLYKTFDSP